MVDCKKIAFVCNVDYFFLSHRLPLAEEAIKRGYEVFLLTKNTGLKSEIEKRGIYFIDIPFERSGKNPIHEFHCVAKLCRVYNKYKFDIIHHITLKASLLGSLAAKITRKPNVVNAISGFGYNFTNGRNGLLQKIIKILITLSFQSKTYHFILQNEDDLEQVAKMRLVLEQNLHLIEGSGIDLDKYRYSDRIANDKKIFLFPARLLYDKGLKELLLVAHKLYHEYIDEIKFVLVGDIDPGNLASISVDELKTYLIDDYIEWKGYQKDMYTIYCESDIVVLPSYREGLPKSLIEACAVGRPIITTNAPGCKACIWNNGENGILVEVKDILSLEEAIVDMCRMNNEKLVAMGKSSRSLAENKFSIEEVKRRTFSIYDLILGTNENTNNRH